jgi:hypothetical protein
MKKLTWINLLLGLSLATPALAQSKGTVGADLGLNIPLGNFGDATSIGFAGLLHGEYTIMPQLNLTGRTGFIFSLSKSYTIPTMGSMDVAIHVFPIWVGAKYFVWQKAYAAAELGMNMLIPGGDASGDAKAKFGLNFGGGYEWNQFDFRLGFHLYDLGHAGDSFAMMFSAGYNFFSF